MFYYYDRDRDGIEHCYEVPDNRILDSMEERLLVITNALKMEYPVDWVKENDVFGYPSAEAYFETHDDEDFAEPICAVMKGIQEIGYPFVVYSDVDHHIHACSYADLPLRELVQGYARYSGYQILPDWYRMGGIDIDTANRYGMSGLLRFLRRDMRKAFLQFLKDRFRRRRDE